MVDPGLMCDKHLLGEHVEMHMLVANIDLGKSIKGYLNGLIDPNLLFERHGQIAAEMEKRGMKHHSPIEVPADKTSGFFARPISESANRKELADRCEHCMDKMKSNNTGSSANQPGDIQ